MIVRACLASVLVVLVAACAADGSATADDASSAATETGNAGTAAAPDDGGPADETAGEGGAGEGGAGEGGAGEGGGEDDLDQVEAACEANCDAQFATECPPPQQNTLTCKLQCAAITLQLGTFCFPEYTAMVQCQADGGYACNNGYPVGQSVCTPEASAFQTCISDLGCKRRCADGIAEGCLEGPFDGCLQTCIDEKLGLEGQCGIYLDQHALCQSQLGIVCNPTAETAAACNGGLAYAAECLAEQSDDLCAGHCYIADTLGCGDDCPAQCAAQLADATCGQAYANLIECGFRYGDVVCNEGQLNGIGLCESAQQQYDTCLGG